MAKAKLAEYKRKRDPKKTPEPFSGRKRGQEPIFVVQRHDASRLHYDFRLERDGALASWAVPKGVPLEPGQQHLAVHVEDHPLEYATFEGEIPKGQYGAGTVELWDQGTYELVEEKKNGGLTVRLHGKRLEGTYALVPAKLSGDPRNWLIIRKRDQDGAASRRARGASTPRCSRRSPTTSPGAQAGTFEIKWDGYRIIATVAGSEAELRTRKDQDYTERFANVAKELAKALKTPDCVVDGEVCALDENGRPSFSAMQQGKTGTPIVYFVFDLLEVEGEPIVDLPLVERRKRLEKLLDKRNKTVRFSESFEDGRALLRAAKQQKLEGIMAKRLESKYLPGKRTRDWLKIKPHGRQEFVIAGYTRGQGRRSGTLGSLVLGAYRGGELVYVGNVGTGFTETGDRSPPEGAQATPAGQSSVPRIAEDAEGAQGRRGLGRSEAGGRGRVRRVDARRPATGACLQGASRRQGRARRAHRGADGDRDPQGQARAQALESRQALLARGGHYQGRPPLVLPISGRRPRPAPEEPAVHDEALPRRLARASSSSRRTRPSTCRTGSRRARSTSRLARARAAPSASAPLSSTTSSRSSGW